MQMSLEIGTIDIRDNEVATFIKGKSVDEIKLMFINLLKKEIKQDRVFENDLDKRLRNLKVINPEKGKRVKEAIYSLNRKLEPLKMVDLQQNKDNYFKKKFVL